MIDVLATLARLQKEKREQNIVPDHIEFARLMNEVSKEVRSELNRLYKEEKIGITPTLNGTGVYVKGG